MVCTIRFCQAVLNKYINRVKIARERKKKIFTL